VGRRPPKSALSASSAVGLSTQPYTSLNWARPDLWEPWGRESPGPPGREFEREHRNAGPRATRPRCERSRSLFEFLCSGVACC
jgi:hypothetical protein